MNCFGEQGWRSIKKEVTSDLSFSLVLTLIRGFFLSPPHQRCEFQFDMETLDKKATSWNVHGHIL